MIAYIRYESAFVQGVDAVVSKIYIYSDISTRDPPAYRNQANNPLSAAENPRILLIFIDLFPCIPGFALIYALMHKGGCSDRQTVGLERALRRCCLHCASGLVVTLEQLVLAFNRP